MVYRDIYQVKTVTQHVFVNIESADFKVAIGNRSIVLMVMYRPPNASVISLAGEFADLMESHIGINCDHIILGDFNVPVNKPTELDPTLLLDAFDSFNLNNRVDFPTHRDGNIVDLIMHDTGLNIMMLTSQDRLFSDHSTVIFDITINGSVHRTKQAAYHKIKI